ncbi:MAG: NAD(P)/FAD-dependent oxidoreductase [Polyangiales bacterium]
MSDDATHFDVIIIGAGLSGVGAAWHLQDKLPHKTYAILEGRERMGGTWDLFRYPGIRSDSDMYTLGYSFRPWTQAKAIADGPSILAYIRDTAREAGIDRKVRYGHRVERASWSSADARWTLEVRESATGELRRFTCSFVFACAGYYDYEAGHAPAFAGRERFRGTVVHPQHWPERLDYEGKRVVVVGSGATAMTLVPELAKRAAHVTMLQRSPTYVIAMPGVDRVADWLRARLPAGAAYEATRWKNVLLGMAFYKFTRRFPERAKRLLVGQVRRAVGGAVDVGRHFTPRYNPWDQRLCLVPDGDLFETLRDGRASVVTDEIETFTETGLQLKSGASLDADIVVTATGLELKFLGGVALEVDGRAVEPSKLLAYKGMMFGDVPNLAVSIGYTNASWTLKCDLTCEYVCRLLQHMDRHGYAAARPHNDDPSLRAEPLLDFAANYVLRAVDRFPRQGDRAPWRVYQNYALDRAALRHAPVDDGVMRFSKARP